MINRAQLRGKPLDKDCHRAYRSTNEDGPDDDRVFCFGLEDAMTDELYDKCKMCGAHVNNATPLKRGAE